MEETYTTKQGDAWDAIAFRVYGDVKYTGFLMQANFPHLDTFVFDAGVVLQTPAETKASRQPRRPQPHSRPLRSTMMWPRAWCNIW